MRENAVSRRRVTIGGGGFTAASAAIQFVRSSSAPLAITVIESGTNIGGGLAYLTDDSDHRLNAPTEGHLVDSADHTAFQRWCMERRIVEDDPDAVAPDRSLFVRRRDFGAFVNEIARSHAKWPTGSTIHHLRDMATDTSVRAGIIEMQTARRDVLASELLIVATSNALPRLPVEVGSGLSANPVVIAVPSDLESVRNSPTHARVLVIPRDEKLMAFSRQGLGCSARDRGHLKLSRLIVIPSEYLEVVITRNA